MQWKSKEIILIRKGSEFVHAVRKMKKRFDLEDLDCANCAAKMEAEIAKIEGVNEATVSFMAQKLTIEAEESDFDTIMKKVAKVIKKIEPDCRLVM